MLDMTSDVALYKQLSMLLREKIDRHEWKYNDKIPTETELCEQYHISRATVRLAIEDLKNQGLVRKRQGLGTFVTHPMMSNELSSFRFFDVDEKSTVQSKRIVSFEITKASELIANKLQIPLESGVFRLERLFYNDGIPVTVAISYLSQSRFPGLTVESIAKDGLYNSLGSFGFRPNLAYKLIHATIITGRNKTLLEIKKNLPGFYTERLSLCDDLPVEFVASYMRGDVMKLSITTKA